MANRTRKVGYASKEPANVDACSIAKGRTSSRSVSMPCRLMYVVMDSVGEAEDRIDKIRSQLWHRGWRGEKRLLNLPPAAHSSGLCQFPPREADFKSMNVVHRGTLDELD